MSDFDPNKKVYEAQGGKFSIIDLLRSFADPDLEIDGISRISDLHMKVIVMMVTWRRLMGENP